MRLFVRCQCFALSAALLLACFGSGCADSRPLKTPTISGTIESDHVRAASRYGGRVEKILAEEGAALKAGQVIAVLEAAELAARREQAAALLAELKAGPRPEEIATARHEWEAVQAELEFVNADDRRSRELFEQKAIAESERDRVATRARVLEKSVAAAKSRFDLLLAGTRPERLVQAGAHVQEIDSQLREMKIVAPADCVLELLHVKAGDVLAPNHPAATLLFPKRTWVRVFVPEPWLGHIRLGQAVKVRVDSFATEEFQGEVEQINREAEFTPRNVQTVGERIKQVFGVKIRLSNAEDKLRSGMAADVIFPNFPGQTPDPSKP